MIGEREFFNLWKRIEAALNRDPAGTPRLIARDLLPTQHTGIVKSNGAKWTQKTFDRPMIVTVEGPNAGREIWYTHQEDPGDVSAATVKLVRRSTTGLVQTFNAGRWYFCVPLIAGEAEGDIEHGVVQDAMQQADGQMPPANQIIGGNSPAGTTVDIAELGGTAQSAGVDLGKLLSPVTWGAVATASLTGADSTPIGAVAGRRALQVLNEDTALTIWLDTAVTATTPRGLLILGPGDSALLGPLDFPPTGALHGRASAAGPAVLSFKSGT
jgi:hypothetical protein